MNAPYEKRNDSSHVNLRNYLHTFPIWHSLTRVPENTIRASV